MLFFRYVKVGGYWVLTGLHQTPAIDLFPSRGLQLQKTWHQKNIRFVVSIRFYRYKVVVSTVVSGIHFARFPTVECITSKDCSFLLLSHSYSKKFQSRWKVHFLWVGLLLSSHSFSKVTFIGNNTLWIDPATHLVVCYLLCEKLNFPLRKSLGFFLITMPKLELFETVNERG